MTGGGETEFQKVTHCIFDMDGLLLDTEKLYTKATQMILDEFGKTYTWDVKASVMGQHHEMVSKIIVNTYNLPISWQEYSKRQRDITKRIMLDAEFMPDTEPIYQEVVTQLTGAYGKPYPFEVRMKILGTSEAKSAEIVIASLGLPLTIEEYMDKHHKLSYELLAKSEMMKGAARLVRHLHANNIPIALATSSSEEMVQVKISRHREVFDLFNHKVCGTDPAVKEGKPAPDVFLAAASRFADKPDTAKCLVFEDAPNGVQAARAAGMQVVIVPDPNTPKESYNSLATLVLGSLNDFKPELFGLPPFQD